MVTLIASVVFVGCLLGMGGILYRKIPLLIKLTEISQKKEDLFLRLKKKVQKKVPFQRFSYEIFLQKLLSKIRILTLKTENKTSLWLQELRERAKEKKGVEKDNYWDDIKKSTKSRGKKTKI
ncbi:hypothetical protein AMJ50_01410 [Parcubacteria bacterium DG_74_3]|nr:MAG: hypothetical protein AMJ50_01410 [Parcubacteria bacterium DG_74_3]